MRIRTPWIELCRMSSISNLPWKTWSPFNVDTLAALCHEVIRSWPWSDPGQMGLRDERRGSEVEQSGLAISSVKSSWNPDFLFPFSFFNFCDFLFLLVSFWTFHAVGLCTVSWMRECKWFSVGLISLVAVLRQLRMKDQMFESEGWSGKTSWFWGHRVVDEIRFVGLLRRPHPSVSNRSWEFFWGPEGHPKVEISFSQFWLSFLKHLVSHFGGFGCP